MVCTSCSIKRRNPVFYQSISCQLTSHTCLKLLEVKPINNYFIRFVTFKYLKTVLNEVNVGF